MEVYLNPKVTLCFVLGAHRPRLWYTKKIRLVLKPVTSRYRTMRIGLFIHTSCDKTMQKLTSYRDISVTARHQST